MTEGADRILTAIRELIAEVRGMREEARAEHGSTEILRGQREKKAASQKKWRCSVSGDSTRSISVASTPVVVDLDLKQRDQDQKQLLPARRHKESTRQPGKTTPVWNAYSAAYEKRHGCEPADSGAERGKLMRFMAKVPEAEAPEIASFFLTHNDALYIRAKHPIDLLVRDAQKLRTEWMSGQQVTGTEAREQERTQANVGGWERLQRGKNGLV